MLKKVLRFVESHSDSNLSQDALQAMHYLTDLNADYYRRAGSRILLVVQVRCQRRDCPLGRFGLTGRQYDHNGCSDL